MVPFSFQATPEILKLTKTLQPQAQLTTTLQFQTLWLTAQLTTTLQFQTLWLTAHNYPSRRKGREQNNSQLSGSQLTITLLGGKVESKTTPWLTTYNFLSPPPQKNTRGTEQKNI